MSSGMPESVRLTSLKRGESATIVEVEGTDSISSRLMEMGLIEGEPITMLGAAPLGDPLEYQVLGFRISLRSLEAERVLIESLNLDTE